jgi:uncharacterized protein YjeT (DUF2065 family)
MSLNTIVLIVVCVVAGLHLFLGLVRGMKRGLAKSFIRTLTIVLSAVAAFFITEKLYAQFGGTIENSVRTYLEGQTDGTLAELINASPAMMHYLLEILCALISPILYAILFFILRLLTLIVYGFLCMFLPKSAKKPHGATSRLGGAILSIAGAGVIVISLLMPAAGYLTYAAQEYPTLKEAGLVETSEAPEEEINAISDNAAIALINRFGGEKMFNSLVSMEDGTTSATAELNVLLRLVPKVMGLQNVDFNAVFDTTAESPDMSPVSDGLLPVISDSAQLREILAELMSTAATKWKAGESFLGINIKEQLPSEYATSLDGVLTRLSTTTSDNVVTDLNDLVDTVVLVSDTFRYMSSISDTVNVSDEQLRENMKSIIMDLTPGSAELIGTALTDELIGNANLSESSTSAVKGLLLSTLTDIADMESEEEREAESDAINTLISYTSESRRDSVSAGDIVDAVMESTAIKNSVIEKTSPDAEEKTEITVSVEQKEKIEAEIALRALTANEEDQRALAAISALFVVQQTAEN